MKEKRHFMKLFSTIWFVLILNFLLFFNYRQVKLETRNNVQNKYEKAESLPNENHFKSQEKSTKKTLKKIAFGTSFWGNSLLWGKVFKRQLLNKCEEKRCSIMLNERDIDIAHAVVFNANDLVKKGLFYGFDKPSTRRRRADQIYVFFTFEPPPTLSNIRLESYNDFFNWTMTYRRDSDVVMPYGRVSKRKKKNSAKYITQEELEKKKMAMWMASHCHTQSKRDDFVKKMERYIPLDTFGGCGNKKCGSRTTIPRVDKLGDESCEMMIKDYSFYLALENSLCDDYVTEKFYRSLKLGVIPVVLGGVNYTSFAPPYSFIDARNFDTIADLTRHLKRVTADSRLYNQYLKWQEEYDIELGSPYMPFVCDLCKKLHEEATDRVHKSYRSIKDWFSEEKTCFNIIRFK